MKQEEPWIGFVHVQPSGGTNPLGEGFRGAFTHAIALAGNADSYKDRIRRVLEEEGLFVIEFRDVAPVIEYRNEDRISPEMDDLITSLTPAHSVEFDTFDAYREYDA